MESQAPQYTEKDYTDFAHTSPGTLAGKYMRRFWQPVYIAEKLARGDAVPIRIMSEDFTLYRGEGGEAHVVAPRCPHRGAALHVGWVVEDTIRCMYHGWRYDGKGRCVEAPAELPSFASRISIKAYPTREYLGLVFAYLGEGDAPPFPRYPEFEVEGVLDVTQYIRMCNYFNNVENNVDPGHTPFTHAVSSYVDKGLVGIPDVSGQESDWGIVQFGKRPNGGVRISQHGQPNILNLKFQPTDEESGWKDLITWRIPVDDTYHVAFLVMLVHVTGEKAERYREWMKMYADRLAALAPAHEVSQKILRGEMRVKDILDRPDYFEIQDHVAQMSQGVIANRSEEKLGRSDVLVVLLRKIWAREMRALAEGRPLKQWERTASIVTTTGLEHVSKSTDHVSA